MFRDLSDSELRRFLEDTFRIDDSKLEDEMREHSYKYAELGVLLAKARAEYEALKFELQVLEANLGKHFREILAKVTEKAVEDAIMRTAEWQEAKKKLIEAKQEAEILSALVSALEHKKDMIIGYLSWRKESAKICREV